MMKVPKAWYAIAHISEFKNKPQKLERFGLNLVVWKNDDKKIIIMDNNCPHRGAELSSGKVIDNCITCPFHGFQFNDAGNCKYTPETQCSIPKLKAKVYPTKIIADMIWINIFDEDLNNDYAFEFCQELFDSFNGKYAMITDIWNNNIRHCIENQLDYTHLATVHKRTIGKGYKIPDDIKIIEKNNNIEAIKNGELMIKYIFPNAWLLNISNKMKVTAYFVPINENQTKIYILHYRNFLTTKILKPIMDIVFSIGNRIVLNEDKRVVNTQRYTKETYNNDFLLKHDQIIKIFRDIWKKDL
ncbi:Rieske 2Fe-2S domain-containing protein [Pseudofrancisella aestuarii]|uniref:Rieske 2Fe-2S domain-containing protein n=1 Tax=Pseudofrancisella aestuarii TaxID=2670347 RepID=A0ABV9TDK1_9GAMM